MLVHQEVAQFLLLQASPHVVAQVLEAQDARDVSGIVAIAPHGCQKRNDRLGLAHAANHYFGQKWLGGLPYLAGERPVRKVFPHHRDAQLVDQGRILQDRGAGVEQAHAQEIGVGLARLVERRLHGGCRMAGCHLAEHRHYITALAYPVSQHRLQPLFVIFELLTNMQIGFGHVIATGDGDQDQRRGQGKKGQQVIGHIAQRQHGFALVIHIGAVHQAGSQGVGDAVDGLFGHYQQSGVHWNVEQQCVGGVGGRSPYRDPEDGVCQHQADFVTLPQQTCAAHFSGENYCRVGVVPQHIGVTTYHGRGQHAAAQTKQLQCQHGEDAAEQKIDVQENRKVRVIAQQAERHQQDKERAGVRE